MNLNNTICKLSVRRPLQYWRWNSFPGMTVLSLKHEELYCTEHCLMEQEQYSKVLVNYETLC